MGALAYDNISKTDKIFDHTGPGLNCKVTGQQEYFGGCAGNIAFGLRQLKQPHMLLSIAGNEDFNRYAQHLGNAHDGILTVKDAACAKANIITDPNGAQFTAFSPGPNIDGAAWEAHLTSQPLEPIDLFVCAPFPALLMQTALRQTKTRNPDIFNLWVPGQYADSLDAQTLINAMIYTDVLVGNAHELNHIRRTSPRCLEHKTIIETDGPRPVRAILADGNQRTMPIPSVVPQVDPTGCGDAFVAGLIPGILRALDDQGVAQWESNINSILRGGIHLAGRCLSRRGSQTYDQSSASSHL